MSGTNPARPPAVWIWCRSMKMTTGRKRLQVSSPSAPGFLQSMGVRTAKVQVKTTVPHYSGQLGHVPMNERLVEYRTTKVKGWVERLYHRVTGEPIRKGQSLLSYIQPGIGQSAQKEYLLALKGQEELRKSPFPELRESASRMLAASRQRLEYWDIRLRANR